MAKHWKWEQNCEKVEENPKEHVRIRDLAIILFYFFLDNFWTVHWKQQPQLHFIHFRMIPYFSRMFLYYFKSWFQTNECTCTFGSVFEIQQLYAKAFIMCMCSIQAFHLFCCFSFLILEVLCLYMSELAYFERFFFVALKNLVYS